MGTCFNIYDDGQSPFKKDSQEEDEKSGGSELRKELGTIIYVIFNSETKVSRIIIVL